MGSSSGCSSSYGCYCNTIGNTYQKHYQIDTIFYLIKGVNMIIFSVPIWFDRKIEFELYKTENKEFKYIKLIVIPCHKYKELKEYKHEWFYNSWHNVTLFKWRKR